jgi:hypothetical protein
MPMMEIKAGVHFEGFAGSEGMPRLFEETDLMKKIVSNGEIGKS